MFLSAPARLSSLALLLLVACSVEEEPGLSLEISRPPAAAGASGASTGGAASAGVGGDAGGGGGAGGGGAGGVGGSGGGGVGGGGGAGGGGGVGGGGGNVAGSSGAGGSPAAGAGGAAKAGASGVGAGGSAAKAGASGAGAGGGGSGGSAAGGAAGAPVGAGGSAAGAGVGGGGSGGGGPGECPPEMAPVGAFCVDRWEAQVEVEEGGVWTLHSPYETLDGVAGALRARSSPGVVPQGYISGAQAREACEGAGKRLCTRTEYQAACRGPDGTTYPYGDTYAKGVCNEGRETHPIIELFGSGPDVFNSTNMNDPAVNQLPDSLAPTGQFAGCVSGYGAYDMTGNLHEWIDEDAGTFCGGFYVDAVKNGPGCLYVTTAHTITYHDYSTGFRCCLTP